MSFAMRQCCSHPSAFHRRPFTPPPYPAPWTLNRQWLRHFPRSPQTESMPPCSQACSCLWEKRQLLKALAFPHKCCLFRYRGICRLLVGVNPGYAYYQFPVALVSLGGDISCTDQCFRRMTHLIRISWIRNECFLCFVEQQNVATVPLESIYLCKFHVFSSIRI